MKKILILILTIFTFASCSSLSKQEQVKKEICAELEKSTGDKFWFIYGLDREYSIATNIKYRGIVYSDKLEKLQWPQGVEVALDNLSSDKMRHISDNYKGLLRQVEIDGMAENKARKIFGEKVNLYNDWSMNEYKYKYIKERLGKKNLGWDDKNGAYSTIVNYFVEDLDKLNNEEIKQKTFELAKFIYDEMNYVTGISVYVRDGKYFEDYNLVYYSIYKPFREREDIQKILGKIKKKEKITEEEKEELLRVFVKGSLNYENCHYKLFLISFDEKHEIPIEFKNISYESEIKNQQELFLKWRDEN